MDEKKEAPTFDMRDFLAIAFLKDFIAMGYPALDITKQVEAAYQYADAVMGRRAKA